ncbi:hypothetical protein ACFQ2B_09480 [Streptomyces stramineus]
MPVEDRVDGAGRGFDGQVEVGAGVAVRDGVDVDRVDLLAGPAERVEGQSAPGTYRGGVQQVRHRCPPRIPGGVRRVFRG